MMSDEKAAPNKNENLDLAIKALSERNLDKAESLLRDVIRQNPSAVAYNTLGITYIQKGDMNEAKLYFNKALEIDPKSSHALNNLGNIALNQNDFIEAKKFYNEAIEANPNSADFYNNLGSIYQKEGDIKNAIDLLSKAITIDPKHLLSLVNLGKVLSSIGELETAKVHLENALKINPDNPDVILHLAGINMDLNNTDVALEYLEKAESLTGERPEINFLKGLAYIHNNNYNEAIINLEKSINPNVPALQTLGQLAELNLQLGRWAKTKKLAHEILLLVEEGVNNLPLQPFIAQVLFHDNKLQLKVAKTWSSYIDSKRQYAQFEKSTYNHKKIKVGYISSEFSTSSIGLLVNDMFKLHSHEFETYGIILKSFKTLEHEDILSSFDEVVNVEDLKPHQIAHKIHELEIDILVDLNGPMDNASTLVFSYKPAPVQCHFLGITGTKGADYIPYYITHETVAQEESCQYFSEKLVYLPDTPFARKGFDIPNLELTRSDFNLPNDAFVYACHHHPYRINPLVLDCWMKVLNKVPNSVLWLTFDQQEFKNNVLDFADSKNFDLDRIILTPATDLTTDWRITLADLWLDPLNITSRTAAFACLWAELPMLTNLGDTPQARICASFLDAVGLPELIAKSKQEYFRKAVQLGKNPDMVKEFKEKLRDTKARSALFDPKTFINNLEKAFHLMLKDIQSEDNKKILRVN